MNILNTIGNTPLVQLQNLVPAGSARIFVKLESHNPTARLGPSATIVTLACDHGLKYISTPLYGA